MSAFSLKRQNAQQTPYTPADSGNWSPIPDRVNEALDQLAQQTSSQAGFQVQTITVSAGNILSGSFELAQAPSFPAQTMLFPDQGPIQKYGVDYEISGTTLSWLALGLATKIEANDVFIVHYKI
jgi:hypothetical protein